MSQPQELPSHFHGQELPAHNAHAEGQYYPPPAQHPISEYVPTPSETPAPLATGGVSPQSYVAPPPQAYMQPDQYGTYPPPQEPQEYYQKPPVQGEYDAEKAGVPAYIPPAGGAAIPPAYIPPTYSVPPTEGAAAETAPGTITLFGKTFMKKTVIIAGVVALVVLIFIIGLGAGLGSKNKNKKGSSGGYSGGGSYDGGGDTTGCSGCYCITDMDALQACLAIEQEGRDNASDLIKRLLENR